MSEHDQQFETFQEWVNKASSWLTRRGPDEKAVCFDKHGNVCTCGAHFEHARACDLFPVRWIWPHQAAALALAQRSGR